MTRGGRWLRLAGASLGGGLIAAAVGYFPTMRLAGEGARGAMAAGVGIGIAAGWLGSIPMAWGGSGAVLLNRLLAGTAIRMFAAVVLGVAVALAGWFALGPLLLWLGISYLAALGAETFVLVTLQRPSGPGVTDPAGTRDAR